MTKKSSPDLVWCLLSILIIFQLASLENETILIIIHKQNKQSTKVLSTLISYEHVGRTGSLFRAASQGEIL